MSFELRPYQATAVQALRNTLARGLKRVILSSPTGSGKTEMGFEIIRGAMAKGKKVAFIANRVHLVEQTCRRLSVAGFDYGVIQGQNTKAPWSSILVCSIQTIHRRGLPEDIDLLVIDEAHACAGTEAYHVVMAGKPVIGLTATPYSKGLGKHHASIGGELFQEVVVAARIEDLIRDGYLVSADIWAPGEPDLTGVKITAGDYNEKQLGEAVDKAELIGDIVSHWFKHAHNTPTVCFATNISHSKHIVEQFKNAGVAAEHIDCYTDDSERIAILGRVASGETMLISNVGILAEGWDFPACKTLILARPTKSLIRYLQMAGRVLRPYPGKPKALILDHSGSVRRLGFPWDDFGQKLDDGKATKSSSAAKAKEESLPKTCKNCDYVKPAKTPKCPSCGFESRCPTEIETIEGDLVAVTEGTKAVNGLKAIGKAHVFHQLRWIADQHGYKDGWAAMKYRTAFGTWPNGIAKCVEEPCGVVLAWVQSEQIRWAKSNKREA